MRTLLCALLLGLAVSGGPRPALAQDSRPASNVEVQNNFDEPITVFLEFMRYGRPLGIVDGHSITTLPLPGWAFGQSVRLFVVRRGLEELQSQRFEARPGHTIAMIVPRLPTPAGVPPELPPDEGSNSALTITNERDTDVDVFASVGMREIRLGTVPAQSTATLELPLSVVGTQRTVTLIVHPKTGFDLESYPLRLRPGQQLGLTLPALR